MRLLKKLPYPMAGLALGMASYGNLLIESAPLLKTILGLLAGLILVGLSLKSLIWPAGLSEAFNTPPVAGTLMTFPMALMILATYLIKTSPGLARLVWLFGLALAIVIGLMVFARYILKFDMKKVFTSYFVAFVGIVAASITAKPIGYPAIGRAAFWIGLIIYPVVLYLVSYRYLKIRGIPAPAKPTGAIFAAPASLLLAGYLAAFDVKSPLLVYGLFAVALVMTLIGLAQALPQLTGPFFPSMAAFTFPFVISAVAMKMMAGYLTAAGRSSGLVNSLFWIEFVIAGLMIVYSLIRYFIFLSRPVANENR